jgi:Xaa-Pro aminopeptidase
MTRTFVVGEVSEELRRYHDLVAEALEAVQEATAPGVSGARLHGIAAETFEAAGYPTLRTKDPGEPLLDGFFHTLGHGVGLRLHEPPHLDPAGPELLPGDVIALEPGCYRQGYGGVRLEDLMLVTETGAELLTHFPYALRVSG